MSLILEANCDRKDIQLNFIVMFIFIFRVIDCFEAFNEPKTFVLTHNVVSLASIAD